MAFSTFTPATAIALEKIKTQAAASGVYLTGKVAKFQQASVLATEVIAVIQHFQAVLAAMDILAATPGIAQFAKDYYANQAYSVVTEYNAMTAAMRSAQTSIIGMFPKDANGFASYQTIGADGSIVIRTFTTAQLAPVVALLNSVIPTITNVAP